MRYDLSFKKHLVLGLAVLYFLHPVVSSAANLADGGGLTGLTDARDTIKPYRTCREMKRVSKTLDAAMNKLARNDSLIKSLSSKPNNKRIAKIARRNISSAKADLRTAAKNLQRIKRLPASCAPNQRESKLARKRREIQDAANDKAIDSAKATYDEAKEQYKRAMQILQQHTERQTQVVQQIAR